MSSDEALACRAKRLSAWQADRAALLQQADAFVVVSWWQEKCSDGRTGDYEYEHRPTLNDALDSYREYEDGEYERARAVGIFAVRTGLPIGGRLDPAEMLCLMKETRHAGSGEADGYASVIFSDREGRYLERAGMGIRPPGQRQPSMQSAPCCRGVAQDRGETG